MLKGQNKPLKLWTLLTLLIENVIIGNIKYRLKQRHSKSHKK